MYPRSVAVGMLAVGPEGINGQMNDRQMTSALLCGINLSADQGRGRQNHSCHAIVVSNAGAGEPSAYSTSFTGLPSTRADHVVVSLAPPG